MAAFLRLEVAMLGLVGLLVGFAVQAAPPLQRGLESLRSGHNEQARAELEEASRAQPENAYAWVALAEVYRRLKQSEPAGQAAAKAEQLGGAQPAIEHALALFYAGQGQYAHAAKLEEQYAGSAKGDAQAEARAAGLYLQAGDEPNGERLLRAGWERSRTDPAAAFQYAQILLHKLDFSGAAQAVSPALSAHPDDPQLVLTMGVVRYGQRRFDEAVDEFLKVIALDGAIPQPYDFLGRMLEQAGPKLPEIRRRFEERAAKNPRDSAAQLLLAKIRLLDDAKDGTVEGLLRRSIGLDARNWESHYELGVVLESRRDFKGAAEELERASELNDKEAMPHYHLARVYDRLGETERAQAERRKHEELTASGK